MPYRTYHSRTYANQTRQLCTVLYAILLFYKVLYCTELYCRGGPSRGQKLTPVPYASHQSRSRPRDLPIHPFSYKIMTAGTVTMTYGEHNRGVQQRA